MQFRLLSFLALLAAASPEEFSGDSPATGPTGLPKAVNGLNETLRGLLGGHVVQGPEGTPSAD